MRACRTILSVEQLEARELSAAQLEFPDGTLVIILSPVSVVVLPPLVPRKPSVGAPARRPPLLVIPQQRGVYIPPTPCVFGPLPRMLPECLDPAFWENDDCL
jgi:hypothetical protein